MKIFLVIDDAPVIRKVARRILTDLGFVVIEAADGLEALEKCRSGIPDAMIVDSDMPGMSGVEFLEEFSRIEGWRQTRILYSTSEVLVAEMTKAKRAGAHGFLLKPFNREILQHKLGEVDLLMEQHAA